MADPFVAEIRVFSFNFAPHGWATCDGQFLPISQNTALFSLLGTYYGGDGKSNFALPNLQARAPMHFGEGLGLSSHYLGEAGGSETVTLLESEMPQHTHAVAASTVLATTTIPTNNYLTRVQNGLPYKSTGTSVSFTPLSLSISGGSVPHNNMQPYLVMNFCIAMQGIYPPRG